YQQLYGLASGLAQRLGERKSSTPGFVAVYMNKGYEQVVAVLGALLAGYAYVPIDVVLPEERVRFILEECSIKKIVTQEKYLERAVLSERQCVLVDNSDHNKYFETRSLSRSNDTAYIIFTSGSTGEPKGVVLDHRGPVNTILDLVKRFKLSEADTIFGISSLSFDLSVFDIFGAFASGSTLVLPEQHELKDPKEWLGLLTRHDVTLWNSAPALMQMFVEYLDAIDTSLPPSLRTVMLSGDWVPIWLAQRIKQHSTKCELISLGGATEASIWSNYHVVEQIEKSWRSIPYGLPLNNQRFYILDSALNRRPLLVEGDLYISGMGLAQGYWNRKEITDKAFFTHPELGERLYKTGDKGRYMLNGEIEFLGREDGQIKLQGYRVELGEIESALQRYPNVTHAVVIVAGTSKETQYLVAYIATLDKTVDERKIKSFAAKSLPEYMVPEYVTILERFPITSNGKVDRKKLPKVDTKSKTEGPQSLPLSSSEVLLEQIWWDVLDIHHRIPKNLSFFDCGGSSFLAVRLVATIKKKFGVELPIAKLLQVNTIEELAQYIDQQHNSSTKNRATSIVEFSKVDGSIPLVLIHPVGGGVLCYSEIARKLRPLGQTIIGLQSLGVFDPDADLSIEEIARNYSKEILSFGVSDCVDLGGWSMGGVLAAELARQLGDEGVRTRNLLFIDSPLPIRREAPSSNDSLQWFFRDSCGGKIVDREKTETGEDTTDYSADKLLNAYVSQGLLPAETQWSQLEPYYLSFCQNLKALSAHEAKPVIAEHCISIKASILPGGIYSSHPYLNNVSWGWDSVIECDLDSHIVTGDHYSIMVQDQSDSLSRLILKLLATEENMELA
ncbi:MAG: amino acid adenylation domain-containing protein, partial [Gammaproteobacteria bacterium]|nr:amino acid adenylation domain-containing protein [Gammaproteobacteria bacterium]